MNLNSNLNFNFNFNLNMDFNFNFILNFNLSLNSSAVSHVRGILEYWIVKHTDVKRIHHYNLCHRLLYYTLLYYTFIVENGIIIYFSIWGGGVSRVRKIGNPIFIYQLTQKDHNVGQRFGRVFRPQAPVWRSRPFSRQERPKNRNWKLSAITLISHQQSIDNSFLSSHKKFSPIGQTICWVMTEKRMLIYGIIGIFRDFLAFKLAKYQ